MKCPGQDSRYWKPDAIFEETCPGCGATLEFFKDDTSRMCRKCGRRIVNPHMNFGCAAYCRHAEKCIGVLPPETAEENKELLKQRIALKMKNFLGTDFESIGRSVRAAAYAERLAKQEKGDPAVITAAAYLLYVGPEAAGEILAQVGTPEKIVDEVSDILSRLRHPEENESVNFKAVFDANILSRIEADVNSGKKIAGESFCFASSLLTCAGKRTAKGLLA
jgi:hypothetical protein